MSGKGGSVGGKGGKGGKGGIFSDGELATTAITEVAPPPVEIALNVRPSLAETAVAAMAAAIREHFLQSPDGNAFGPAAGGGRFQGGARRKSRKSRKTRKHSRT